MMLNYYIIINEITQEAQKLIEERPSRKKAKMNLNLFG
jgi:hypothetical protein